jgi:GNAT superfamily N-acetyltransferase
MIRLERVIDAFPDGFATLRDDARRDGHHMLDTLATEWASRATRFDKPSEALYAAYADEVLAGIGGLTKEPAILGALRLRRFYVRVACRRLGVGRALAEKLLEEGGRTSLTLTANAAAGSEAFWEALGFVPDRRDGRTHIRS